MERIVYPTKLIHTQNDLGEPVLCLRVCLHPSVFKRHYKCGGGGNFSHSCSRKLSEMDKRADNESAAAGMNATSALSCPTDATGAADSRAASVEDGCGGESSQNNSEIELQNESDQERLLLSLFERHVTTLATEFPEVYAQLLEAFLQELFRMDTPPNLPTTQPCLETYLIMIQVFSEGKVPCGILEMHEASSTTS